MICTLQHTLAPIPIGTGPAQLSDTRGAPSDCRMCSSYFARHLIGSPFSSVGRLISSPTTLHELPAADKSVVRRLVAAARSPPDALARRASELELPEATQRRLQVSPGRAAQSSVFPDL